MEFFHEVNRMRNLLLLLAAVGLIAGVGAAQYHAPVYIAGGYGSTSTTYWNGFWMLDAQNQTVKHLTPSNRIYSSYNVQMDADNKHVVFAGYGSTSTSYASYLKSGIFRIDPATSTVTTVLSDANMLYQNRRLLINQDGDYIVQCYQRTQVTPSSLYRYAFLKVTAGSTITTILNSTKLGTASLTTYSIGKNMDTGHYLMNVYSSPSYYYAVLDVDNNGNFTTFGGGASPNYGWYGYYSNMEQDHDTGHIMGQYSRVLYQLKKGDPTRTTLYTLGYPGGYYLYSYGSNFDLQSAPARRIVASGYKYNYNPTINDPAIFYIDVNSPGVPGHCHQLRSHACDVHQRESGIQDPLRPVHLPGP